MGEAQRMKGLKITRPGTGYYFDGGVPMCPMCNSNDLGYCHRVEGKPRTAEFKCKTCSCKFEKTRTLDMEPEGYTPESQQASGPALVCNGCGAFVDLNFDQWDQIEEYVCPSCGAVLKEPTGQQA